MCDDATIMHLVLQGTSWNEIETIGIKLERKWCNAISALRQLSAVVFLDG